MSKGAVLSLKITGDPSGGLRALDDTESKAGRLDGVFGKMGLGIAAGAAVGAAALVKLGTDAFSAASDVEQSTGSINAVFGDWAVDIEQAADGASKAVGLSTSQYENMAAVIGAQLHNAGMAHDEMKDKTEALISKGADMAAVFGGTAADAVDALSSALKGEMDPIERYGVSLNQAAIQSQMAADHTDKLTGAAANQAKTNAILELITKQTGETQGQWAQQSGTAAEAQQILSAKVTDVQAKIGSALLPAFAAAASFISDKVIPVVSHLFDEGQPIGTLFSNIGSFITDHAIPAFQAIWGYLNANVIPIFRAVLGPAIDGVRSAFGSITGAIADNKDHFIALYDNIKPFLTFLKNDVAPFVGGTLKLAFEALGKIISVVVSAIAWVLDKAGAVIGFIGKVGGFLFGGDGAKTGPGGKRGAVFGASAGGGGALFAAATSLGGAAGGSAAGAAPAPAGDTYVINVSGALDPTAVADQIGRLLDSRARRLGQRPAFGAAA